MAVHDRMALHRALRIERDRATNSLHPSVVRISDLIRMAPIASMRRNGVTPIVIRATSDPYLRIYQYKSARDKSCEQSIFDVTSARNHSALEFRGSPSKANGSLLAVETNNDFALLAA
ncbi:hypothetical protein [Burkholderia sp. MSMB0856]|uniref:hypothetical protein n=1 Tax=Burkholderia sp. MSMB0856 TaxID=1637869 RepID=UPI00131F288C|nr:hypothetical protein [Burkholderia sp. MSMB0856]